MMSLVSNEDHNTFDQGTASAQAVESTDFDQDSLNSSIPSNPVNRFHIEHSQSCASNRWIFDRLQAKLCPRSQANTLHRASDGTQTFLYFIVSAPRRMDCPACGLIAEATRLFWQDEELKARSYGWGWAANGLLNTRYPADEEHLQFFTKPGDQALSLSIDRDHSVALEKRCRRLEARTPLYGNFSEQAISWANECIDRCDREHPMCFSSSRIARLPTRVLDLEVGLSHNVVRLVNMQGKSGRYICLSHCWGKGCNKRQTTKATLEANKASIPVDQLPPSMQDAIAVTRKFSIRYLWIDSLCIVQDSLEDWSREAAQMASIYENAFLTIGATSTASDEEAFLRPLRTHRKLQVKTLEGTLQELYVEPRGHIHDQEEAYHPLLQRAWCYQERLLSSRMLHFTRRELWWECRSKFDCECGDKLSHRGIGKEKTSIYKNMAQPQTWYNIVEDYSRLNLTMEKDKLPALSGLAQKVYESRKDKYLAGLWSHTIVDDLCWWVLSLKSGKGPPREWRAPSWSWASVHGEVYFCEAPRMRGIYAADIDVIACETVPIEEDQFGGVRSGFLTIRGKLSLAKLKLHKNRNKYKKPYSNRILQRLFEPNPAIGPEYTDDPRLSVEQPRSSIFMHNIAATFLFSADHILDYDVRNLAGRLFKLRMYRVTHEREGSEDIYNGPYCQIGYMIVRSAADGSSDYERIGWANFLDARLQDIPFPELLDGETVEVITIV